jgi:aminomuconate-semialdehyde/2-hydroxymuconate-6-semialdehyde dehydrogenase
VNQTCASSFKKVSLELGGKNAMVVFGDADIDAAIDTATAAAFANQGQICLCTERLLIEASVYDQVLEGVVERARALRIGDPLESDTDFGSLISSDHRDTVEAALGGAIDSGACVCTGGTRPTGLPDRVAAGAYFEPTVLQGIGMDARFNQEEVFGPVVCAMPFDTEAEAIHAANDTRYGLCATVCTQDADRANRVAKQLDVGTVWTNCWLVRDFRVPFGGVKHSGLGSEGGDDALHFCTEARTLCTATMGTVDARGAVPEGTT